MATIETNNGKTVYILGAGFSAPAGGPPQAALLRKIFALPESRKYVQEYKNDFHTFLVNVLNVAPDSIAEMSLEDIYTPIDRCLADGVALRGMSVQKLQDLRAKVEFLISVAIDDAFISRPDSDKQYINDFARHLVQQASKRSDLAKETNSARLAKKYDPLAIISLNWDIALDQSLFRELAAHDDMEAGDYSPIGVVDYCCYISSLEEGEPRIRSGLWALGSRGYNLKLLKIHGSMNWLQCTNCQRLFVGFDEKTNIADAINKRDCRHCREYGISAKLQGSLVMPTFLKDLSNFQIKLVWQNAAVELMEAKRLVFIGYSLPHADFEFRQLLSRMIQKDIAVHVVLFNDGSVEGAKQYQDAMARYNQFFSSHSPTFESHGVTAYVRKMRH